MKFNFSKKEIETLVELVYLGNWTANAARSSDERVECYDRLFNKIFDEAQTEIQKEMSQEDLYDNVEGIIKRYETDIFPSLFAKQYADFLYPYCNDTDRNDFIKKYVPHKVFRELCEKEMRANGFRNIQILLPELENKIEETLGKDEKKYKNRLE